MDVVSELVDEDIFGGVRITGHRQDIFLGAGADGIGFGAPEAPGSSIPKVFRLHGRVIGNIGRELGVSDDDDL